MFFATDTRELSIANAAGNAWQSLGTVNTGGASNFVVAAQNIQHANGQGITNGGNGSMTANNNGYTINGTFTSFLRSGNAGYESAAATAGGGAAVPATVAGFLIIADHTGTVRKVPYFAN